MCGGGQGVRPRHYSASSLYTHGAQHWWDIKVITNGKIGRATAEEAAHRDLLAVLHISYDPPSIDDYGCIKTPSNRLPIMGICTALTFIYVFYSLVGNSVLTRASETVYIMGSQYSETLAFNLFLFTNLVRPWERDVVCYNFRHYIKLQNNQNVN